MLTIRRPSNLASCEPSAPPMRSDQLLRSMHKVMNHDLPNELVVLQSLLQLLEEEESSQLSKEGREYVSRLQNATRRAGEMVRFLKEMGRLNTQASQPATIFLAAFTRELQGELHRLHPGIHFQFDWQLDTPTLHGDSRVYLRAILELLGGFISPHAKSCVISARAQAHGDAVELALELTQIPAAPSPLSVENRMELILARESLALCGAGVEVTLPANGSIQFSLVAPS
jgi:light-regulated signal transduction histidine kinase (bacteriophytochrome)